MLINQFFEEEILYMSTEYKKKKLHTRKAQNIGTRTREKDEKVSFYTHYTSQIFKSQK